MIFNKVAHAQGRVMDSMTFLVQGTLQSYSFKESGDTHDHDGDDDLIEIQVEEN